MIIRLILCFLVLSWSSAFATDLHLGHLEKWYQERFCSSVSGEREVVLEDKTRIDCVSQDTVWEVEFAHKWTDGLGQALHYGVMTGKQPGVALIVETAKDQEYFERLQAVVAKYGLKVKVKAISASIYK